MVGLAVTRQDVIAILGEPSESAPPPHGNLTYRFDNGLGGWEYLLTLDEHTRVSNVTGSGID
jgi:hypothetical protein